MAFALSDSMNVLFLSNTRFIHSPWRDGSTRYRCYHMAEALQQAGHIADVSSFDQLDISTLERYDIVSVSRPQANRRLFKLLARCAQLGIHTVADMDDLIFVPELAAQSAIVADGLATAANVEATYTRHKLALQHFDEVTVSTNALALHRREQAPTQSIHVLANGLSQYWLDRNSLLRNVHQCKRLSFMSGKRGQEQDFAQAQSGIAAFLTSQQNSELMVIGALQVDAEQIASEQLVRGVWTDYMDLPLEICQAWANVAPYQNTPENKAKSHISFIEAAAFGVPSVASSVEDFTQHNVNGLLIADTPEQWQDAFDQLLDPTYYEKAEAALPLYVRTHCTASKAMDATRQRWQALSDTTEHETFTALSQAS